MSPRSLLTLVVATVVAAPAPARADDTALAEALFREGRTLMKQRKAEEACPKFAESHRLDPSVGTLLNLALCHEEIGKTASAWSEFEEVAHLAKEARQTQRHYFAKRKAALLEKKLSRIRVELAEPVAGTTVQIDERELSEAALATPLPLDPGSHRVVVSAPGHEPREKTVELSPDDRELVVEIPKLVPLPPKPAPPPEPPPPLEPDISPFLWAGGAVAVSGLLIGSVTGAVSLDRAGQFRDACPENPCDPALQDLRDEGLVFANVANVAFVFAGLGVAAGVVGYFLSDFDPERREPPDEARWTPRITPGGLAWDLP